MTTQKSPWNRTLSDDWVEIDSIFPETQSEVSDSEHHPGGENTRPAEPEPNQTGTPTCPLGHVFPDLHPSLRGSLQDPDDIPDSPMSPPDHERGVGTPPNSVTAVPSPLPQQRPHSVLWYMDPEVDRVRDCIVCGRSYRRVLHDAAAEYLRHTNFPGEPIAQRIAKRDAFVHGMRSSVIHAIRGGVSQVATCDGNVYEVYTGVTPRELRNQNSNLPLFE